MPLTRLLWLFVLCGAGAARAELRIDGVPDEPDWAAGKHITDFRVVQPLTGAASAYPTEAWILATPQGLAIAFRNLQSAATPRTRQRIQRDEDAPVDRVNLMVDFDADGGTGYNFTLTLGDGITDSVISNETNFRKDWDGDWEHAVAETADGWSAEMLIPWHIAPMKEASAAAGGGAQRRIGIYLDRVIGATGERVAWPAISFLNSRFLSDFVPLDVPAYMQALLAVTPYAVSTADLVHGGAHADAGADVFWKPSGRFQLTASVNPDFGQVESDELVVNFDAVETFFSDKRPFFTENQGLFDVPFGPNAGNLIYTRRVGGPADDGRGAADVVAALKLNGSLGATDYGLLFSNERGAAGRDFLALRARRDFGAQDLGIMATEVRSPFLDRNARVLGLDHHWKPNSKWDVVTQWVGSSVDSRGTTLRDSGAQIKINNEIDERWRQNLYFVHLGDGLQLNDFGYLDRNNFNYLRYEIRKRVTSLPADSSYRSLDWSYAASMRRNDHGDRIFGAVQLSRNADTVDGGYEYFALTGLSSGYDDLLTRGHGKVALPSRLLGYYERSWARQGHWSLYGSLRTSQSGFEGLRSSFVDLTLKPTYHVNDALSFNAGVRTIMQPDWLLWSHDNLVGTYRSLQLGLNAGMQWSAGSRHELRFKLEAIGLHARAKQAWRIAANGGALAVTEPLNDFSLRNLGVQLRYRYELAPLSYVYAVYSRGGFDFSEDRNESAAGLFNSAFSLRDDELLLVKVSYRFRI